jgi:hypothetical protein
VVHNTIIISKSTHQSFSVKGEMNALLLSAALPPASHENIPRNRASVPLRVLDELHLYGVLFSDRPSLHCVPVIPDMNVILLAWAPGKEGIPCQLLDRRASQ